MLKLKSSAPQFNLPDQNGKIHNLKMYKGKKVLLYFYPKDDTPGCTTEACSFRDNLKDLAKMGLVVIGISKDSVKSHDKFAKKYDLNFPILSDEEGKVIESYDAWGNKKFMGREYMGILRKSFLINEEGKIEKIYEEVKPAEHVKEVKSDII